MSDATDNADLLFELSVSDAGRGRWQVEGRAVDELGRERSRTEIVASLPERRLNDYRAKLQGAMFRGGGRRGPARRTAAETEDAGHGDQRMAEELGELLFRQIFHQTVFALYDDSLARARQARRPLRVRLSAETAALANVPWETLYNPNTRRHLCLDHYTPFARAGSPDPDPDSPASAPLRILGMAARITDIDGEEVDPIDADAEHEKMRHALTGLEREGLARLSFTPSGTLFDLEDRVYDPDGGRAWDVFHFIGHGGYDADRDEGFVAVRRAGGTGGQKLYASDLRNILACPTGPKLVVLNSCSGAETGPGQLYASTAATLMTGYTPAVVAMQFAVTDPAAIAFTSEFYRWLARGKALPEALTHTRMALRRLGSPEWITPVLFMRTRDGHLFRQGASNENEARRAP